MAALLAVLVGPAVAAKCAGATIGKKHGYAPMNGLKMSRRQC
jgi:hypothetical protein